jgi:hypothetical protein
MALMLLWTVRTLDLSHRPKAARHTPAKRNNLKKRGPSEGSALPSPAIDADVESGNVLL